MTKWIALVLLFVWAVPGLAASLVMYLGPDTVWTDTVSVQEAVSYLVDDSVGFKYVVKWAVNTGDVNLDGNITIGDIIYLVWYILKDGPRPKSPFVMQAYLRGRDDKKPEVVVVFVDSVFTRDSL